MRPLFGTAFPNVLHRPAVDGAHRKPNKQNNHEGLSFWQPNERLKFFTAGCSVCNETVVLVKGIACSSCDVQILDMHKEKNAERAKQYGIRSVPAVFRRQACRLLRGPRCAGSGASRRRYRSSAALAEVCNVNCFHPVAAHHRPVRHPFRAFSSAGRIL